ncbi:allantoicase, partial [Nannochloropsis gaditana CCMP526]
IKVPGSDWAVLRLGTPGKVRELEIDTCWFKGNYPESCQVEAVELPLDMSNEDVHKAQELGEVPWRILLPRTKLGADQQA